MRPTRVFICCSTEVPRTGGRNGPPGHAEPVLAALAQQEGLTALANVDDRIPAADTRIGRFPSHWVLLARNPEALALLAGRPGWRPPAFRDGLRPWTDDYSNIIQVLTRRH
jgi:hypothetical protein